VTNVIGRDFSNNLSPVYLFRKIGKNDTDKNNIFQLACWPKVTCIIYLMHLITFYDALRVCLLPFYNFAMHANYDI